MSQLRHTKQQRKECKRKGKEDRERFIDNVALSGMHTSQIASEMPQIHALCEVANDMYNSGRLTDEQWDTYQDKIAHVGIYLLNCLKANEKIYKDKLSIFKHRLDRARAMIPDEHIDSDSSGSNHDQACSTRESSPVSSATISSSDSESRAEQARMHEPENYDNYLLPPLMKNFIVCKSAKNSDESDVELLPVPEMFADANSQPQQTQAMEQSVTNSSEATGMERNGEGTSDDTNGQEGIETNSDGTSDGTDLTRGQTPTLRRKVKQALQDLNAAEADAWKLQEYKDVHAKITRRYSAVL